MAGDGGTGERGHREYFRSVALDYDGTITQAGSPDADVLDAVDAARRAGLRVVLVTGRIRSELEAVFPDVRRHFDALVAENGALVCVGDRVRPLGDPVDDRLVKALRRRGVQLRAGEVLLACDAVYDHVVLEEVRSLGLDYQIVHNRAALMVLPPGISKGVGLFEALGDLGVSYHNTIGVGDAENDHALLASCELGVAVENALGSLKAHADVVLPDPDGRGVASLLRDWAAGSLDVAPSRRWRVALGVARDGREVSVPASQVNLLVTGPPRQGKSFLAGLLAERLISQGYTVLVADPEGDHVGLGRLRGVIVVSPGQGLPPPEQLPRLFHHRFGSVVLDLSGMRADERASYLQRLPEVVEAERRLTGLPHWLILDEAHVPLATDGPARAAFPSAARGMCLVTYQPVRVCAEALATVDAVVAFHDGGPSAATVARLAAAVSGLPAEEVAALLAGADPAEALLARRPDLGATTLFRPSGRATRHVRHWHKYTAETVAGGRHFLFRSGPGRPVSAAAANMTQFTEVVSGCDVATFVHHAVNGDFSRWVDDVVQDAVLARTLAVEEAAVRAGGDPEASRAAVVAATRDRYLG